MTSTSEKFGRGLSKIKHGVMGKSVEGIPYPASVADPAFDLANAVAEAEREAEPGGSFPDLTVTSEVDLSRWAIKIPRLSTALEPNGRPCFVFVITSKSSDGEWCVQRRYPEFYVLEAKLIEFHGEELLFQGGPGALMRLPPRPTKAASLFTGTGAGNRGDLYDLQTKVAPFEDFLRRLIKKSSLKNSDLIFTFLTSSEEFTTAAASNVVGKMIKNVPKSLTGGGAQRGQGLETFLTNFMASTQNQAPKPRHDYVVNAAEYDGVSDRPIPDHDLFGDNLAMRRNTCGLGHCAKFYSALTNTKEEGIFDTLVYLAVKVFRVTGKRLSLLKALRVLFRNTLDGLVDFAIATKLNKVLGVGRAVYICKLLQEAIFEPHIERTDKDKWERRCQALANFRNDLRHILEAAVGGPEKYEEGTGLVFEAIQNPVINKQLALVLLDVAVTELFPELSDGIVDK